MHIRGTAKLGPPKIASRPRHITSSRATRRRSEKSSLGRLVVNCNLDMRMVGLLPSRHTRTRYNRTQPLVCTFTLFFRIVLVRMHIHCVTTLLALALAHKPRLFAVQDRTNRTPCRGLDKHHSSYRISCLAWQETEDRVGTAGIVRRDAISAWSPGYLERRLRLGWRKHGQTRLARIRDLRWGRRR